MSSDTVRPLFFETDGHIPVKPYYGPEDLPSYENEINVPGHFPFRRGNFQGGYRDRLWTFRQYAGFGTAKESNQRYRYLLSQGGTGLSVAFDLPTQCGYDSDDPEIEEEVGRVGVAIDSLADFDILFQDIPLDQISVSFTINGTAAIILAFFVAAGDRQGVPRELLRGTIQNDILKEYASRGTWIWPPTPSLRLVAETIEFCAAETPHFNAISVAGAHFRDAGATAAQEMAFTLQDGITYCDEVVSRGRLSIDQFAPQISFFFYTHGDFFEEIAKYRAGRRRWAQIVKDRYNAQDDRSSMFRFGCVCGGVSLYSAQAQNNIVRVAYEAMASVLGGVQSMFTAAWDEPFALPTEETTTFALRTQQILAYETGVARAVDPLGGSYFVEALTDDMDSELVKIMADLEGQGGMVKAIENGYVQRLIAEEAFRRQRAIESGAHPVVGLNVFQATEVPRDVQSYEMDEGALKDQRKQLAAMRRDRDDELVQQSLRTLTAAARKTDVNLMPLLIDCAKANVTVGEIVATLKEIWGEFRQPTVF